MWNYFKKFLNEGSIGDLGTRVDTLLAGDTFYSKIRVVEVKKSIGKNEEQNYGVR